MLWLKFAQKKCIILSGQRHKKTQAHPGVRKQLLLNNSEVKILIPGKRKTGFSGKYEISTQKSLRNLRIQ